MRLWHKYFISVLPREQLVAQWRELSSIAGAIQKNGTPNHMLVNFVLDYDFDHFISYAELIRNEMTRRSYKTMDSVWNKIVALKPSWNRLPPSDIYPQKMNKEYMLICYYNLYEKFLCGGFSKENFDSIVIACSYTLNENLSKEKIDKIIERMG